MKSAGYLLLIAGFLGGAFATSLDTQATDWMLFVPAAAIATLGLFFIKRASSSLARSEELLNANRVELSESIGNIVVALDDLIGLGLPPTALRNAIDDRLREDLRRFAEARESIVHLVGLQAYANIMSEFAAGERYVNRVWSASADGYADEAARYLERAAAQFRQAQAELAGAGIR